MSRKMIDVGPMNQFEKQLLESSIDPMTGRTMMVEEKLPKGMRVKIADGSGTLSGKMGVIVDPSEVKTSGRGSPTNVQGAYKPVDWSKEVAIKLDNGEITTMYKNRVSPIVGEATSSMDAKEEAANRYDKEFDRRGIDSKAEADQLAAEVVADVAKKFGIAKDSPEYDALMAHMMSVSGSDIRLGGEGDVDESGEKKDFTPQYEIMDMGYDSPSYFRWHGALYSEFDDAIYDVGMTPREAVEQLKSRLWDIPGLSQEAAQSIADELDSDIKMAGAAADKTFYDNEGEPNPEDDGGENMLYHIGVKYKLDGEKEKIGEASQAFRAKAKKGEVMWSEELAYALKHTAKDIAQRFSKELEQDAAQLAQDMEMNVTDQVRTVSNGVKTLDAALKLFVADELSTDVLGGNPELGILGESCNEEKKRNKKPKVKVIDGEDEDQVAIVVIGKETFSWSGEDALEAVRGLRGDLKDNGVDVNSVDWGDWFGESLSASDGKKIGEAKSAEEKLGQVLPGTNLYFRSFARDVNGNTVIRLKSKDGRGFSIQTNGNLPETHALRGEKKLDDNQLKIVAGEVSEYMAKHGKKTVGESKISHKIEKKNGKFYVISDDDKGNKYDSMRSFSSEDEAKKFIERLNKEDIATESSDGFIIADWAGNVKFDGQKFVSVEDAEEFLSTELGDDYETDRGEYEIKSSGKVRDSRYLDPKDPRAGKKIGESDDDTKEYEWFVVRKDNGKADSGWALRREAKTAQQELSDAGIESVILPKRMLNQDQKKQVAAWSSVGESKETSDPELYISASTGQAQQGGKGKEGRVFGVIYQGQAMMATDFDSSRAVAVADKIAKANKKTIGYWDGDKGQFVSSLKDLTSVSEGKSEAKPEKKTYKKAFSNKETIKESKDPSEEQLKALSDFAAKNGKDWKQKLSKIWMTGKGVTTELQQVRNQFGPSWLAKFSLPQVKEEIDGEWNLDAVNNPDELDDVMRGEAPAEIKAYAKKKQEAMKLRLAGKINDAVRVEKELDRMYDKLPENLKTW